MKSLRQPVKLQDVANASGVSIATASRALAGKSRVSVETTKTVLETAKRLGYQVHPVARALREGSTRTIGMVVPVIANPYFGQLIDAIENELQTPGLQLILADSHGDIKQEAARIRTLVGHQVDGILIVSHDSRKSVPAIRDAMASVPVVQIDRKVESLGGDFVGVDNAAGMRLVVEHLLAQGVRRVVLASSDNANSAGRTRRESFEQLVAELGLAAEEHLIGDFSVGSGQAAAEAIVRRGTLPDAVVAGSDEIAVGLISRLRLADIHVPRDVLVTGFDGTLLAEIYDPPLTTVRQPIESIARTAVALLLSRITNPGEAARSSLIHPELVVRGSTSSLGPRSFGQEKASPSSRA